MSHITLDAIQLKIDPKVYEPYTFPRRGSVLRCIDGSTVVQDNGFSATDVVIRLEGEIADVTVVAALRAKYAVKATAMTFTDWYGNVYSVLFVPGQNSLDIRPIQGTDSGFTFALLLIRLT